MRILAEYWCKGQFQLWNPYAHCGEPQIAIPQPNLFYPPNWTFAWISFSQALALSLVGHQFLAGLGNYLLVASLGWGFVPACVAGLIAALSAYMFSLSPNYTLMASAAWVPLSVWALRSMKTANRTSLYLIISTISLSMMILTGRPEIFAPALLLIGFYILFSFQQGLSKGNQVKTLVLQLLAIVLAIFIAAPFILPTIEWQALSPRAAGLAAKEVLIWSANWYDFLSILLPQPLGDLYVHPDKFLQLCASRPGYPPYLIAFVGPTVIALAVVGILDKSWRMGLVMSAALVLMLVLSAGDNLPLAPYLVSHFPKLAILRFPVKLLFFPVWFLSIFAGRGLFLLLNLREIKTPIIVNFVLWSSLSLIALALPIYQDSIGLAVAEHASASVIKAEQLICQSLAIMSCLGILISLTMWMRQKARIGRQAFSAVIIVSTYALLLIHAFSYCYHGAATNFFQQNPSYLQKKLADLHEDTSKLVSGQARIVTLYFSGLLMPNKLLSGGDPDWPASYYQYGRQILTPSTHFDQKICSSFGYEGAETSDYRKLFVEAFNKSQVGAGTTVNADRPFYRFCQLTSTNYVFGMIDRLVRGKFLKTALLNSQLFELILEDPTWNIRVYKVIKPLPRAYMSYQWQVATAEQAVNVITNADVADFDFWSTTLISGEGEKLPVSQATGREKWHVRFLQNAANLVSMEVTTDLPGMLVLTDHFYPGWLVFVDGKPNFICRANGVLRAVHLASGKHMVEFKYEPDSLKLGFMLSILAMFLLFLIALLLFIRCEKKDQF